MYNQNQCAVPSQTRIDREVSYGNFVRSVNVKTEESFFKGQPIPPNDNFNNNFNTDANIKNNNYLDKNLVRLPYTVQTKNQIGQELNSNKIITDTNKTKNGNGQCCYIY